MDLGISLPKAKFAGINNHSVFILSLKCISWGQCYFGPCHEHGYDHKSVCPPGCYSEADTFLAYLDKPEPCTIPKQSKKPCEPPKCP